MKSTRILLRATRTLFASIVGFFVLACFAQGLLAGPLGTYQEIFVTNGSTTATSTSIGTYNSFVTAQAALSTTLPSGVTWTAVASTEAVAASANAPSGSYPVYDTDGQLISVGNSIYSGTIATPITHDQYGNPVAPTFVFSGASASGGILAGGALGDTDVYTGLAGGANATWLQYGNGVPTTDALPLYALSGPITAAAAGGGIGSVGGAQVAVEGTSIGTFSSTYSEPANTSALESIIGATAYNAINFAFPGSPVFPGNPIQVWDLGLSSFPGNPVTVSVHFDQGSASPSQLADLTIEHFTGGSWQAPNNPVDINLSADTITFQTSSFSPFMLAVVPEPSSLVLLGCGILGFAAAAVRARRNRKV